MKHVFITRSERFLEDYEGVEKEREKQMRGKKNSGVSAAFLTRT